MYAREALPSHPEFDFQKENTYADFGRSIFFSIVEPDTVWALHSIGSAEPDNVSGSTLKGLKISRKKLNLSRFCNARE